MRDVTLRAPRSPGPRRGVPAPRPPSGRLLVLVLAAAVACGGGHRLAEYDFAGGSLALVDLGTPRPVLLTGDYDVETEEGALEAVLDAGSRAAKEVAAREARARLDSAATRVDMGELMADRLLDRGSRYLGVEPVASAREADFLLELDVRRYGIDARSGRDARLFVIAEAVLLDRRTGAEVWSTEVRGRDPLTRSVDGVDPVPSDVFTAGGLTQISVSDFERILEGLADVSADAVADQLREDLREARRDG